jgi:hypothetical protein
MTEHYPNHHLRHNPPERTGFYPQCQWGFCAEEAMVILHPDEPNSAPESDQQPIYACNIHYGTWAQDLGIPEDHIEELEAVRDSRSRR